MIKLLFLIVFVFTQMAFAGVKAVSTFHEKKAILNTYGVNLPIALSTPEKGKPLALILLIPGSFFNDVDGNYPEILKMSPHLYSDLARQLSIRGYTVLRYAKHGPGTGSTVTDQALAVTHTTFKGRELVAKAALQRLIEEGPAGTPIIIAGHSEGGLVASQLADHCASQVSGVVQLSAPALRFFDLALRQAELRERATGPITRDCKEDLDQFANAIHKIRNSEALPDHSFENPHLLGYQFLPKEAWEYLREMDGVDPVKLIQKISKPIFIGQGTLDESVNEENAGSLYSASPKGIAEVIYFQSLQHFYKKVDLSLSPIQAFTLETETESVVADEIGRWISGIIK